MAERSRKRPTHPRGAASEADRVVQALSDLCDLMEVGDRIPTHTALMQRLGSSERFVRQALDQMVRDGRILRRNGVGTFVARRAAASPGEGARTIVAIVQPDRSFFDRFMGLLYRRAEESGLNLVCLPIDAAGDPRSLSASSKATGTILFGYPLEPLAFQMQSEGHRVVLIGSPPYGEMARVPSIFNDHERGGYLATKHLLDLGHRRIVFVGSNELGRQRRWRGHLRALTEAERAGLSLPPRSLPNAEVTSWANDPTRARAFFDAEGAPTAILAWNDSDALMLMGSLARAGIAVPERVSVVGYDALPEGQLVYPSLTTVEHGIDQQVSYAVEFLSSEGEPNSSQSIVVLPNLVVRESTAPPRG